MGALTLWASTGTGSLKADSDVTASATAANQEKGKLMSYKAHQIGASYALSKRTNIYAFTGQDEGKRKQAQATTSAASIAQKNAVGSKTVNTSTHVGIRHSF
jgi:predicted porin